MPMDEDRRLFSSRPVVDRCPFVRLKEKMAVRVCKVSDKAVHGHMHAAAFISLNSLETKRYEVPRTQERSIDAVIDT